MVCVGALLKDPPGGRKCTAVSRKCTSPCVAPNPPQASPRANYFGCIRKHHAEPPQELNLTLESNTHTHHTPHSKSPRHTPGENYWHPTRIVECKRLQPKQGRTHHNSNSSQIMQSQTPKLPYIETQTAPKHKTEVSKPDSSFHHVSQDKTEGNVHGRVWR